MELDPQDGSAYYYRGLIYKYRGDWALAIADFQHCLTLDLTPQLRDKVESLLIEMGVDHVSFCLEFVDPEWFARICPGKEKVLGQQIFFDSIAYCAQRMNRGAVSGEIIAGVEPIEATLRGVDWIAAQGAFPTVCIFRPLAGSILAHLPSPDPDEMREVMAYQYTAARREGLAVGILPNIKVSLVVQPEEGRELQAERSWLDPYEWKLAALRTLARPFAAWKKKPRPGAPEFRADVPAASQAGGAKPADRPTESPS